MATETVEVKVEKQPFNFLSKKVIVISLISFIMLMLAVSAQLTYMTLSYDKIYKGVYINDIDVSKLSTQEVQNMLSTAYQGKASTLELLLKTKVSSHKISFSEMKVAYDFKTAVANAYQIGRSGNIFDRVRDVLNASFKGREVDIPVSYDKDKVNNAVQTLYNKTHINVKDADLLIQENKVTIRSGHPGRNIDREETAQKVIKSIIGCSGGEIDVNIIETAPTKIDVEDIYANINREAKDASVKIKDNNYIIDPEIIGRSIDKPSLVSISSDIEKSVDKEFILPVIFTQPKFKIADVKAKLFKDDLYTIYTTYDTSTQNNRNRSVNIKLASSKINNIILAPGQVFSFNETVGQRTVEAGYQTAYVYSKGKVIPDVGGGICQVSSTLYNAVLNADMEVVERRNHMFIVTYVPYGQDATVFFGQQDFKFKNSTNWPMKIESWMTKDNKLYFSLKGTNENPQKTVEIHSEQIKVIKNTIKYISDPAQANGKVIQIGHSGYVVDTYKTVKVDGKVISTAKISTSSYIPLDQVIIKNPPKVVVPSPTPYQTPPLNSEITVTPGPTTTP